LIPGVSSKERDEGTKGRVRLPKEVPRIEGKNYFMGKTPGGDTGMKKKGLKKKQNQKGIWIRKGG